MIIVNLISENESLDFFLTLVTQLMGVVVKVDRKLLKAFEYDDGDILIL